MKQVSLMRRLVLILSAALVAFFVTSATASAVVTVSTDPTAAPTGTHRQTGTIGCSVNPTTLLVTCSQFELAGVGNTDAEATLVASYTATVQCRNRGGQIVEVKSQVTGAERSTGTIQAKNGRLLVPSLTSAPAPTAAEFEAQATCPNGNWTKELLGRTITLSGFTYELTFNGFTSPYITVTGP